MRNFLPSHFLKRSQSNAQHYLCNSCGRRKTASFQLIEFCIVPHTVFASLLSGWGNSIINRHKVQNISTLNSAYYKLEVITWLSTNRT
jgi:hypothetical protein